MEGEAAVFLGDASEAVVAGEPEAGDAVDGVRTGGLDVGEDAGGMGLCAKELFGLPGGMDEVELARSFQPEGDAFARAVGLFAVTVARGVASVNGLGGGDEFARAVGEELEHSDAARSYVGKFRRGHGEDGEAGKEQGSHGSDVARSGDREKGGFDDIHLSLALDAYLFVVACCGCDVGSEQFAGGGGGAGTGGQGRCDRND